MLPRASTPKPLSSSGAVQGVTDSAAVPAAYTALLTATDTADASEGVAAAAAVQAAAAACTAAESPQAESPSAQPPAAKSTAPATATALF